MEPAKTFPIYQLQDAFEAFCNGEPDVKPQHRSLYYFLIGYCRRRGNTPRFNLAYDTGMHGSGIGSWATYDAALRALDKWGFIQYTPGANRYKAPVVELTFRNPTDDVLLTYWQSYSLSTSNPTDDVSTTLVVTLKEQVNRLTKEIAKLKKGKDGIAPPAGQPVLASSVEKPAGEIKVWPDEAQVFTLAGFGKYVTKMNFGHIDKGFYLPEIQRKADLLKQQRDETGWENFISDFLKNEIRKSSLVTVEVATQATPVRAGGHTGPAPTAKYVSGNYNLAELARTQRIPTE